MDIECIVKFVKYFYDQNRGIGFIDFVKVVISELEGVYGLFIKSVYYFYEVIVVCKGFFLVVGVKMQKCMKVDFVDVEYLDDNIFFFVEVVFQNVVFKKLFVVGGFFLFNGLFGVFDKLFFY